MCYVSESAGKAELEKSPIDDSIYVCTRFPSDFQERYGDSPMAIHERVCAAICGQSFELNYVSSAFPASLDAGEPMATTEDADFIIRTTRADKSEKLVKFVVKHFVRSEAGRANFALFAGTPGATLQPTPPLEVAAGDTVRIQSDSPYEDLERFLHFSSRSQLDDALQLALRVYKRLGFHVRNVADDLALRGMQRLLGKQIGRIRVHYSNTMLRWLNRRLMCQAQTSDLAMRLLRLMLCSKRLIRMNVTRSNIIEDDLTVNLISAFAVTFTPRGFSRWTPSL